LRRWIKLLPWLEFQPRGLGTPRRGLFFQLGRPV
jgi:hypothetical protein